jgi:hypothetical protein
LNRRAIGAARDFSEEAPRHPSRSQSFGLGPGFLLRSIDQAGKVPV